METTQLITKHNKKLSKKTNGHFDAKKVDWSNMPYDEMVELVAKLAGHRHELPSDLSKDEWTSQAVRVLQERYFLKDEDGKILEDTPQMCWRVAWELARAEVKYGKTREQVLEYAKNYYT